MGGVAQTLQKGLDAITAKAKKAGVNVDECLGADEKALLNLPTKAANDATGCVEGLVLKATNSVDDALQKVSFLNNAFFNAFTRILQTLLKITTSKYFLSNCGILKMRILMISTYFQCLNVKYYYFLVYVLIVLVY